jgi:hypothetical protein
VPRAATTTDAFDAVAEGPEVGTLNTAAFVETDSRTTLTVLVEAPSKDARDAVIDSGMEAGIQDALDLLEEVSVLLS